MSESTKRTEPRYPPKMVCTCDAANQCLYICMPENSKMLRMEASTNDVPLDTAKNQRVISVNCGSKIAKNALTHLDFERKLIISTWNPVGFVDTPNYAPFSPADVNRAASAHACQSSLEVGNWLDICGERVAYPCFGRRLLVSKLLFSLIANYFNLDLIQFRFV